MYRDESVRKICAITISKLLKTVLIGTGIFIDHNRDKL